MPGYLLDTNHITAWEGGHPKFVERNRARPVENIIWVCPISLGEMECGIRITNSTDFARRSACRKFLQTEALDFVWPIKDTTRISYADVMEKIWRKHPPPNRKVDTQAHLAAFGVDVNDVWIVAVALEANLTLVTSDQMATIRDCVPELRVENWLV